MNEDIEIILESTKEANDGAMDHLKTELMKIRAGKANPSMLDSVMVNYYETPTPLSQVANVNTLDARTLTVQPWEKGILDEVSRGIVNSNLGLAPQNNGEMIIITLPPLTEERRAELVKSAKAEGEHAKVSMRNNRKAANDQIKSLQKDGLSEDIAKDAEEEVQKITNSFTTKIDDLITAKEKDIMTV